MNVSKPYSKFSQVYDRIMSNVPYSEWVNFTLELYRSLNTNGCSRPRILDLGCGTGTAAYIFADYPCSVVGVDISEDMLTQASVKASSRDEGKCPEFLRVDIRELPFKGSFDLAVCYCDGINHLIEPDDVRRTFAGVYRALAPGGLFVFDTNSEYRLASILGDNVFYDEFDGGSWVMENSWDPNLKILESLQHLFLERGDGLYVRDDEICIERAYTSAELSEYLFEAGLHPLGEWADYSHKSLTETTERQVFAAAKRI